MEVMLLALSLLHSHETDAPPGPLLQHAERLVAGLVPRLQPRLEVLQPLEPPLPHPARANPNPTKWDTKRTVSSYGIITITSHSASILLHGMKERSNDFSINELAN